MRRASVVAGLALLLGGVAAASALARDARAQGVVSGVVALEERPGAEPGDVRTAVVYLESVGARLVLPASDVAREMRSATIEMKGREFIPHVRTVLAGGTVGFPNEDPFSHNVFSNVELGPFDLGLYRRHVTRTATFARPGVYPIYCNIHSKMVSFVVAVPTPYVTQPDARGRFALRGVPPGSYVLHAWHERGATEVTREIVVPAEGVRDQQLTIDARAYVGAPHLNKFGLPYALLRGDRY
jgi:plastocyanin